MSIFILKIIYLVAVVTGRKFDTYRNIILRMDVTEMGNRKFENRENKFQKSPYTILQLCA